MMYSNLFTVRLHTSELTYNKYFISSLIDDISIDEKYKSEKNFNNILDYKEEYLKLTRLLNSLYINSKYLAVQYFIDLDKNIGMIRYTPLIHYDGKPYRDFEIKKPLYNKIMRNTKKFFNILGIARK